MHGCFSTAAPPHSPPPETGRTSSGDPQAPAWVRGGGGSPGSPGGAGGDPAGWEAPSTGGRQAWGRAGREGARAAGPGCPRELLMKTFGCKTSSYKVIFTRKLCFVDLLLCAERILITTF